MPLLRFPALHSRDPISFYGLEAIDEHTYADITLTDVKSIHEGKRLSVVYRATAHATSPELASQDVVCKVAYGRRSRDSLHHEARIYDKLRALQGRVIPRCLGLYEGELEDGLAACLLLEYCGAELVKILCFRARERQVLDSLQEIHRHGVQHNDVRECNIVVSEGGRPIIIDFDVAQEHDCKLQMDIKFDQVKPDVYEFGCHELHRAAVSADAWLPRVIPYLWYHVPIEFAESPELLATQAPKDMPPDDALKQAQAYHAMFLEALRKRERGEPYCWRDDRMVV
ncbi:hypothetical protein SCP_1700840 [Sparassis crispa]|uniref:Protein kinase domain-containing protein n=1 Tax=Sparassis crispa TaxID=139825 RepID=A0A401H5U7_9APHY|nr:hypothetical protein SCP_1700840 [Sparassis crispa]GBE89759.1 hypothetical protein SCP_1700840 [Sparassis crispa]